jgi:hypothetical protein
MTPLLLSRFSWDLIFSSKNQQLWPGRRRALIPGLADDLVKTYGPLTSFTVKEKP